MKISQAPKSLLAMAFADMIRGFTRYPLWILISIYLLDVRHLDYLQIGFIFLFQSALSTPFSLYAGKLSDIKGRRMLALLLPAVLMILYLGFFLIIYINFSVLSIALMMATLGTLNNVQWNVNNSIVTDISSETERLNSFSLVRVFSNAGIGIGLIVSGIVALSNPAFFFIVPSIGCAIEILIILMFIPESLPHHAISLSRPKARNIIHEKTLVLVSTVLALGGLLTSMFESPLLPLFLSGIYGYNGLEITSLYAINAIIVISLQFRVNALSRKFGEVYIYVSGLIIYGFTYLVFGFIGEFPLLCANVVVLTLGENMTSQFSQVSISRIAPEGRRGEYFGFSSSIFGFVYPFSAIIGPYMLQELHDYHVLLWGIICAACLIMSGISIIMQKIIPMPGNVTVS